jgi:hypothetical protein
MVFLRLYLQAIKHDRVDERRHANANGPASDTEPIALCSQVAREDLRWKQKRDSSPCSRVPIND